MKKMLFIMNPFAGVKRANRHLADILLTFTQMLIWWSAAAATGR